MITSNIYYVGVNDRNKHRFEGLWPLPNGVSWFTVMPESRCCLSPAKAGGSLTLKISA